MKRQKRYWTFTEKQKRKAWRHTHTWSAWNISLHDQQLETLDLERKLNNKGFFDENYKHPSRTGRNTAKWNYW